MMKPNLTYSTMLVALLVVTGRAAQEPGVRGTFAVERASIPAGEPLVITVRLENITEHEVMLPPGELNVDWKVKRVGSGLVCAKEPPHGEALSFARTVPPHGLLSFSVIAYETAALTPGRYELDARYDPANAAYLPPTTPSPIAFEVLPGDNSALAKRAQELHDKALDQSPGWEANARAARAAEELASMDYAGSGPLLCDVLKRNAAAMGYALRRLERHPDEETVNCLVEYYGGAAPSMARDAVEYALKDILRDQRDPELRARILTVAAAFAPEPTCPQLASAEPSALVSYLDGPQASQTAACIAFSIRQIGAKKYAPGVLTLIRHLDFRREPDFWGNGEDVVALQRNWYPAVLALSEIGMPAVAPLVDLLGNETTPLVRTKAIETLVGIYGDDSASAVKLLRAAAVKQEDKAAGTRLLDAAAKAAKICPVRVRLQCEDALR